MRTAPYHPGVAGSRVDVLGVTDSGNTARVAVNVGASVAISPTPVLRRAYLRSFRATAWQLSASGGSGAYAWKLLSNLSGATVSGTGLYTAGSDGQRGRHRASKRRRRAQWPFRSRSAPPSPSRPPDRPCPSWAPRPSVAGRQGAPYTWKTSPGSGTPTINASGVYTAGRTGNSTDQITAKDSLGKPATIQVYAVEGARPMRNPTSTSTPALPHPDERSHRYAAGRQPCGSTDSSATSCVDPARPWICITEPTAADSQHAYQIACAGRFYPSADCTTRHRRCG